MNHGDIELSTQFIERSPEQLYDEVLRTTGIEADQEYRSDDDFLRARTETVEPGRRIVQRVSTADFPDAAEPARFELLLEPQDKGTNVVIRHRGIPKGHEEKTRAAWEREFYHPLKNLLTD